MDETNKTTIDHDEIQKWVEERGGSPAIIAATGGDKAGRIVIDFPDKASDYPLKSISWKAFFVKFEEEGLTFSYEDDEQAGQKSRFHSFALRQKADEQVEAMTKTSIGG
jgi:hypothetical protein